MAGSVIPGVAVWKGENSNIRQTVVLFNLGCEEGVLVY